VFPKVAGGTALAEMVTSGQAELALGQIVDFTGRSGLEVVGALPSDLQTPITFAGAVLRGGNEELGAVLLGFLRSADAVSVIKAKGMDAP
ncbi:MAG TPA: substrate-binding domain-containing protein, partial [Casimicrobiaceae bacterium]|nr:substrate-binding domain-containing protein [Casimicrobiaceae bacterium]